LNQHQEYHFKPGDLITPSDKCKEPIILWFSDFCPPENKKENQYKASGKIFPGEIGTVIKMIPGALSVLIIASCGIGWAYVRSFKPINNKRGSI
jgi:hypothetical protein